MQVRCYSFCTLAQCIGSEEHSMTTEDAEKLHDTVVLLLFSSGAHVGVCSSIRLRMLQCAVDRSTACNRVVLHHKRARWEHWSSRRKQTHQPMCVDIVQLSLFCAGFLSVRVPVRSFASCLACTWVAVLELRRAQSAQQCKFDTERHKGTVEVYKLGQPCWR